MGYISSEEFLKQSNETQKVFIDWWKPERGDLYADIDAYRNRNVIFCILGQQKLECIEADKKHGYYVPLLTETQLRKFIEEKTGGTVDCAYYNYPENDYKGYTVEIWTDRPYKCIKTFKDLGKDLLQAYWQLAIKIAEEI